MALRFFHPSLSSSGDVIELSAQESAHALRVMRMSPGDELTLLDGEGTLAQATLLPEEDGSRRMRHARCAIHGITHVPPPAQRITLCVAPPRSKNMDLILKAATELGVHSVIPVLCRYAVSKPDASAMASWQDMVITAAKQSGNPWLPALSQAIPFSHALEQAPKDGIFGAVPRHGESCSLPAHRPADLALWIGPEGGFAPEEEDALRQHGYRPFTVGPWILRVETAVTALLGALLSSLS